MAREFAVGEYRDAGIGNAAMLMGGMGPVDTLHTTAGKWFASAYALYCGLVLLIAASILFAPVLHRLLHSLHVTTDKDM